MIKAFFKAIPAGMMIAVGSAAYLLSPDKVFGSILFCVGLFSICAYKLNLFTGKIGYVFRDKNPLFCLAVWLGNLVGCFAACIPLRIARPDIVDLAGSVMQSKLQRGFAEVAILAAFCGILIYIAVDNFINNESPVLKLAGILLCVPAFIFCGFEHSIADMCYSIFAFGSEALAEASLLDYVLFIIVVSVFNGVGSLLYRILAKDFCKKTIDKPAK